MKKILALTFVAIAIFSTTIMTSATSFTSYNYNSWGEAVVMPAPYTSSLAVSIESLGLKGPIIPTDMFVSPENELYILAPNANSVIVLNAKLEYLRIINRFTKEGVVTTLGKDASGIFVDKNNNILVADKSNKRAFMCNQNGEIIREYIRPTSPTYPPDVNFIPSKILEDSTGNVYILVEGLYYGAVIFDSNGGFLGFFGSNKVKVTAAILADYFWKKIMTKEQKNQLSRYIPVSYTNMCIDEKNFIYTCTDNSLRKLNPGGSDVLRARKNTFFGDAYTVWDHGKPIQTNFSDLIVEKSGIVSILDRTRGKIFQYDADSNLLFAFGGKGVQLGIFSEPVAIEYLEDKLLVLDSKKRNITVFETTRFGSLIREAVILHSIGKYDEAQKPWNEVLKADANYEMAYIGIGKAQYNLGKFENAMNSFKLGSDRENYSISKKEFRTSVSQKNFGSMASVVIAIILAIILLFNKKRIARRISARKMGGKS